MFGAQSQGQQPTAIKAVRVQTSTFGAAIPLVYGTTRVTINLLWYGDFVAFQSGGGK